MPIEFYCPQCNQRMRTPDESAGKRARCPSCEAIVDVPDAGRASEAIREAYRPPEEGESPFGGSAEGKETPAAAGVAEDLRGVVFGPPTPPRRAKVTFDDMLQRTWAIFTQRIGTGVLYALILLGVNMAVSTVTGIINFGTQLGGQAADMFWIAIAGQAVSQIISLVFQAWLTAGAFLYMLDMARYGRAQFSDIFRGHPYLVRVVLFNLLVILAVYGIPGLLAIPGIVLWSNGAATEWIVAGFAPAVLIGLPLVLWLTLCWYLTLLLIVERDQKLLEAIRSSWYFMRGNRLIVFAGGAAVGAICLLFIIITCFTGILLVIPFGALFSCVIYLLATGQGGAGTQVTPPAPAKPDASPPGPSNWAEDPA